MGFLDNAKKKAVEAAELARQKAEEAAEIAKEKAEEAKVLATQKGEKLSELSATVSQSACGIAASLTEKSKQTWHSFVETVGGAKDASLSFLEMKIRSTVRNWNLQETIDAMKKAGEEKNVDVSSLVVLVEKLKQFGDGE